jgi:hypothetical protein
MTTAQISEVRVHRFMHGSELSIAVEVRNTGSCWLCYQLQSANNWCQNDVYIWPSDLLAYS